MHEPVPAPKRQAPYVWLVVGLAVVSVCAMVISLSSSASANKNLDALLAAQATAAKGAEALSVAQAAASARERALMSQLESLTVSLREAQSKLSSLSDKLSQEQAAGRTLVARLKEAHDRQNVLTAELAQLRDGSELKELIASRKKSDSDLDAASSALRDANAKLAASLARNAELEEENRRLREQSMHAADVSSGYRQSFAPRDDNWAKLNQDFLAKIDTDPSIKKSASGLRYKVIEEGHPARPNAASSVKCRYEGKLIDGKVFDTTKARNNEPTEFPLSGVIPSWTEGLQKIGVGGKIILYCPHPLAYGDEGQGPIPGRSVLIFEVELVEITKFR